MKISISMDSAQPIFLIGPEARYQPGSGLLPFIEKDYAFPFTGWKKDVKIFFPPGLCNSFWLLFIFLFQSFSKAEAQQETNYAVNANIIYHFTKYIEWPGSKKTGDFLIGVVGDTPLYDELKRSIANKTVGARKIVIRRFASSSLSFGCQILFISNGERRSMKKIAARTAGIPILLVTESRGMIFKGACINFIIVSDHLKLEINKNNIEERNLNIASELLRLGEIVK